MDESKAMDDVYLHFSKAFDTVSQSICPGEIGCLEKWNGCPVHWVENWLRGPEGVGEWNYSGNGIIPVNGAHPGRTAVPPQNLHPKMRNDHVWA